MFAGVLCTSNRRAPKSWFDVGRIQATFYHRGHADVRGHWYGASGACVAAEVFNAPWSLHTSAVPLVSDDSIVAFWGRLHEREALCRKLGLPGGASDYPDARLIQVAWARWRSDMAQHLKGSFAIAVHCLKSGSLFLMRDPVGTKPLYFWKHADGFLYGCSARFFTQLTDTHPSTDPNWIASHFARLSSSLEKTAYQEVEKLPGGCTAEITKDGSVQIKRFHTWDDDTSLDPSAAGISDYREALLQSISDNAHSAYPIGCENSGGLDSGSVAALTASELGEAVQDLHAYAFSFFEHEPAQILGLGRACGIHANHIFTSDVSQVDSDLDILGDIVAMGYPDEHINAATHRPFYLDGQRQGLRSLLSGFGGDECVSMSFHSVREELWDNGRYRDVWHRTPGAAPARAARLAQFAYRQRFPKDHHAEAQKKSANLVAGIALTPEVAATYNLQARLCDLFLHGETERRQNDVILKSRLVSPMWCSRLEDCTLMAASYGIEYRWPLIASSLIQAYLSTAVTQRVSVGGIDRNIHRMALRGLVPDLLLDKTFKSMGDPILKDLRTAKQRDIALDVMTRDLGDLHPELKDILNIERLQQRRASLKAGGRMSEPISRILRDAAFVHKLNLWLWGRPIGA